MENTKSDYLKYYPVIKKFVKDNFKLSEATMGVLLFLYSEKYFNKAKFEEFNSILSFNDQRFNILLRDGYVHVFRKGNGKKLSTLYSLSIKSKNLVELIYDMLEGKRIPLSKLENRMFLNNASYSSKVNRRLMIQMHKFSVEKRRAANPDFWKKSVKRQPEHLFPE